MKQKKNSEIQLPKIIKHYTKKDIIKYEKKNRFSTLCENFDSTKISAPKIIFNKSKSKKITILPITKKIKISGQKINLPIYKKNHKNQPSWSFKKKSKNINKEEKYDFYFFKDQSQKMNSFKKTLKNSNQYKFSKQIRFDYSKKENTNPGFLYNNQDLSKGTTTYDLKNNKQITNGLQNINKKIKGTTFGFRRNNKNKTNKITTPNCIGPDSYFPNNNFDSTKIRSKGTTFGKSKREIFKKNRELRNESYLLYSSVGKQIISGSKNLNGCVFGKVRRNDSVGYRGRSNKVKMRLPHACY